MSSHTSERPIVSKGQGNEAEKDAILAPILGFIHAMDSWEFASAKKFFTDSPSMVDGFSPYRWSGPSAFTEWCAAIKAAMEASPVESYRANVKPAKTFAVSGENAYATVPIEYVLKVKGSTTPVIDNGIFTFALSKKSGSWQIASCAWAGETTV